MAAQNNAIRNNYVKEKIDYTQWNSKCGWCEGRDETVNQIVSECSKHVQKKYKTRYDWVGKVIHWELCKTMKFDHTTEWYTHKTEFVQKNETHKITENLKYKRITD